MFRVAYGKQRDGEPTSNPGALISSDMARMGDGYEGKGEGVLYIQVSTRGLSYDICKPCDYALIPQLFTSSSPQIPTCVST
jgi:hypothetical protein